MEFFDRNSKATCYTPDGEHLYLWTGTPVGYFSDDRVYSFSGKLLGWYTDGWLYDRKNKPALFSSKASGGPTKPVRSVSPVKSVRSVRPIKSVRQVAHVRPAKSASWSEYSSALYFQQ
ncbi:4-fold beta flower protein [Hoeflea sp.]|uniref:4-fold beta flower protein n=1 Tax=Hoeflea sp. TaxID=1940281 RepID=UPI003A8DA0D7